MSGKAMDHGCTALLTAFVEEKNGAWNHEDWLGLLARVREAGYRSLPEGEVGRLLEAEKARFLARAADEERLSGIGDALLESAHPDLYRGNAFRVIGLSPDAGPREVSRRTEKIEMAERFSIAVPGTGLLSLDPPPGMDQVRDAVQRLRDPERRLVDELFWFWPTRPAQGREDPALSAVVQGDTKTARAIWGEQERVAGDGFVAMHNLAVFHHAGALDLEHRSSHSPLSSVEARQRDIHWDEAHRRWRKLLEQEAFWSRVAGRIRELDDPRLTTGAARRMRKTLPLALLMINARLAVRAAEKTLRSEEKGDRSEVDRHLGILGEWVKAPGGEGDAPPPRSPKSCPECGRKVNREVLPGALWCSWCGREVADASGSRAGARSSFRPLAGEALRHAALPLRDRVKALCRAAEPEAAKEPRHGDSVARRLIEQTAPLIAALDMLFPGGDPVRAGARDEVALCALACQISFGNETKNWKASRDLLDLVLSVAACESVRSRISENLRIVTENLEYQAKYETCWFCGRNPSASTAAVEVKMHGNVQRHPDYIRNQVRITWQHMTVKVPRCTMCKAAHARETWCAGVGTIAGLLAGSAGCLGLVYTGSSQGAGFLSVLVCSGLGYAVGGIYGRLSLKSGIKALTTRNEFHEVKKMLEQGWNFGEKPATL